MIYHFNLHVTQVIVGAILMISHIFALVSTDKLTVSLKTFPRSRFLGIVFLTVAAAWSFWLMVTMDLGEFTDKRPILVTLVPVAYFLALFFVQEFLAVRALGMVFLLAACILLDSAFLSQNPARLPLVILAYGWIVAALFMVGKPYLVRDAIDWATAKTIRLKLACLCGIIYGAVLMLLAVIALK